MTAPDPHSRLEKPAFNLLQDRLTSPLGSTTSTLEARSQGGLLSFLAGAVPVDCTGPVIGDPARQRGRNPLFRHSSLALNSFTTSPAPRVLGMDRPASATSASSFFGGHGAVGSDGGLGAVAHNRGSDIDLTSPVQRPLRSPAKPVGR